MAPTTLVIDRTFRGVGRIKKATGTATPAVRRKMSRMLTDLHDAGRLDILRAIRDGKLSLLQVYDAHQRKALESLPLAETMKPLAETMKAWIDGLSSIEASDKHKESLETSRRYFERESPKATVAELPYVLDELRDSLGAKHPRSFNLARAAGLAFLRSTLKRSHPLWLSVAAIEPRKVPKNTKRTPLTVEQMAELFPSPETDWLDAIAWGMATTGMHAKEYWGRWNILADRVHIIGTKRAGRIRDVPLVRRPAVPKFNRRKFEDDLRERTREITVYDLRRTYANWLEEAGIFRTRRKLYLGHAAGDVTDLYERHDVAAYLADDGQKLRDFVVLHTKPHTIRLVKGAGAK